MRTLSLALLLASGGLVACNGGTDGDTEICDNGLDDNGDGVVDEGCEDPAEVCDNGTDDDGDGLVDCLDIVDCPEADNPSCLPEDCENGIDDNEDGLTDCEDTETSDNGGCGDTIVCNPVMLLTDGGVTTVDLTGNTMTGYHRLYADVYNNYDGEFEIGDVLCEARYTIASTARDDSACAGCDWTFTFDSTASPFPIDTTFGTNGYNGVANTDPDSATGNYCTDWFNFTDSSDPDTYMGASWIYSPVGVGYDADYTYGGNIYPSAMLSYSDAPTDFGWGGDAEFDSTTGDFSWVYTWGAYLY